MVYGLQTPKIAARKPSYTQEGTFAKDHSGGFKFVLTCLCLKHLHSKHFPVI